MTKNLKLSLVVAVCQGNGGIGLNGSLPWRIPKEMAYFKKLTTETKDSDKQNAVVMGRKTWESIPVKFRPLAGRLNVVISTTLGNVPYGVLLASSFENAVTLLSSHETLDHLENVFIIGGALLYKTALESPFCHRIYLTEVLKEFTCDTFFPDFDVSTFEIVELPEQPKGLQIDGDISYQFKVYQKVPKCSSVVGDNGVCLPPIAICVAMDLNRGFGSNGALPWPPIKKDFQHFTSLVTHTDDPDKKTVIIKARKTWESTSKAEEQCLSSMINIIISSKLEICPSNADYLVKSLEEAIEVVVKLWKDGKVEKIWILGGQQIYQEAIDLNLCRQIYLTRVLDSFDCDVFFPPFEQHYKLTKILAEELDEDSKINLRFEVYDRI